MSGLIRAFLTLSAVGLSSVLATDAAPAPTPAQPDVAPVLSSPTRPGATEPVDAKTADLPSASPEPVKPGAPGAASPAIANAPLAPVGRAGGTTTKVQLAASDAIDGPPVAIGDLWHRIRLGFQMSDLEHPRVQHYEEMYARQPDYLRRLAERGSKYLFHIVDEVEKRGMPTEVALLPIIESAFNPKALSSAKASGLWQFIPSTGKVFGLNQTYWFDNRRDVVAGTRAALDYLQKLHGMFNSWELAFAAYNCGEGCVGRAIAANQKKGLATDFAALNLPNETRDYVPKLMAVKNIISSPAHFGVELRQVVNEPYFARIAAPQMDVKLAAEFAEMSVDDFRALNPAFNKPVALSDHGHILLPQGKVDSFQLNLAKHQHPLVNWSQYHAKKGESTAAIAKRFGVSVAELRAHNGFRERKGTMAYATTLLVPRRGGITPAVFAVSHPATASVASDSPKPIASRDVSRPVMHKVRAGENLGAIAQRHGTTVRELQVMNRLKGNAIRAGQLLVVGHQRETVRAAMPQTTAVSTPAQAKAVAPKSQPLKPRTKPVYYTVRAGDSLSVIADRAGVALADILRFNRLNAKSTIKPGMKLRVK